MSVPFQKYVDKLSQYARLQLQKLALTFGFILGLIISLLIAYQVDNNLWPAVENYRVTSAKLTENNILIISGQMTLARNCRMNYIAFYGEDNGKSGSVSLAHYEREKVMQLTHTIDYGQGQTPFGPITVPVPGANKHDWLTIVSSHNCHPFWPNVTQLVQLYVPNISTVKKD